MIEQLNDLDYLRKENENLKKALDIQTKKHQEELAIWRQLLREGINTNDHPILNRADWLMCRAKELGIWSDVQ